MCSAHILSLTSQFTAAAPEICRIIADLQIGIAPVAAQFEANYATHSAEDIAQVKQARGVAAIAGDAEKVSPGAVDDAYDAYWECQKVGSSLEMIDSRLHSLRGLEVEFIFDRDKTSTDVTDGLHIEPVLGTVAHYAPIVREMLRIHDFTQKIEKMLMSLDHGAAPEDVADIAADEAVVAAMTQCVAEVDKVYKLNLWLECTLSDLGGAFED